MHDLLTKDPDRCRAYSFLHVKAVDPKRRVITGMATTPTPDRMGDIVEPEGVSFTNPLPFLLYHNSQKPVGQVTLSKPTKAGVPFEARLSQVDEPGAVRDRIEEAWHSLTADPPLLTGVSIGFRSLEEAFIRETGSFHFLQTEILELSLVAIPANPDATISAIKSHDIGRPTVSGQAPEVVPSIPPGVTGTSRVVKTTVPGRSMKKSYAEQITSFEATLQAKATERDAIMEKASDAGLTLDDAQTQQYDSLEEEIASINKHLVRLRKLDEENKQAAKPINGTDPTNAAVSRGNGTVIRMADNTPPGIGFARAVICKVAAFSEFMRGNAVSAVEIAKARYADDPRVVNYLQKAAVPAGTTTDPVWAGPLVYADTLTSDFIEFLRPQTIIGNPAFFNRVKRVPPNVRILGQTGGGTGYWVGQGAPKPLTSFAYNATTLGFAKVAAIAVITEELARYSSPSAEMLVRDALAAALIERIDIDLIDPTSAAVTNVQPASLTYGLTPLAPSGTNADAVRTDLGKLLKRYAEANLRTSDLLLIMPESLAISLSLMTNSLGQPEFPDMGAGGGTLRRIPVITTQYAANASGAGNLVIAVSAGEIFLSDDGAVSVDASREASLQMLDNPTNNSATATPTTMVSMFQTNSIALRAERHINWAKRRADAVVYMDDVNWGAIGSPA